MFQHLPAYAGDPILSLNEDFQRDPRADKVNLSIGIYFDEQGRLPVLGCVREAEARLLAQGAPKPYLLDASIDLEGLEVGTLTAKDGNPQNAGITGQYTFKGTAGGMTVEANGRGDES